MKKRSLINYFGSRFAFYFRKKIAEKIIVIESDDWGLERALNQKGIDWAKKYFGNQEFSRWTTDALETPEDLERLFNILTDYKTKFESPPVITANFITHNIDYSQTNELKFLPISEGFNPESADVRQLYRKAMEEQLLVPQLHGYSHYNLTALQNYWKSEEGQVAFNENFFCARSTLKKSEGFLRGEMSASNREAKLLETAASVFEEFFGFPSKSFIPPHFILDKKFMKMMVSAKIQFLQSGNRLINSDGKRYFVPTFRKKGGLVFSLRNARLDPHPDYKFNAPCCLNDIKRAFDNKLPAVIDFHRVNFSGRFASDYRNQSLHQLGLLLKGVKNKWPEVQFVSTDKILEYA